MNHNEVLLKLQQLAESNDEYREFNARIINDPTVQYLGVRIPDLRRLAKKVAGGDWRKFLAENDWRVYELKTIAFLLPQCLSLNFDELFELYDSLIPWASSWANTDLLVVRNKNKVVAQNPAQSWRKIAKYLSSKNGWEVRIGLNLVMAHFLGDEHIDRVLAEIRKIDARYRHKVERGSVDYYVKMMLAWTLAEAAVRHRDKIEAVLPEIDPETVKFTAQKMRDSRRI
jgi:3-methyladenine DNA glycosylase AlkD